MAAVAVLLAVAVGVALVLHARASSDPGPDPVTTTHAGGATSSPTVGDADLTWSVRQGVAFPISASAGPAHRNGALGSGFAQSDLGAAIAAAWITFAASPSPGPAVYRTALTTQVTGPGAAALAVTVNAGYTQAQQASHLSAGAPLGRGTTTFTGYRVTALPGGNRHVTVYERAPDANGVDQVFTLDVVMTWSGGDWKVVAPVSGDWSAAVTELTATPAGVTAFTPAAPTLVGAS